MSDLGPVAHPARDKATADRKRNFVFIVSMPIGWLNFDGLCLPQPPSVEHRKQSPHLTFFFSRPVFGLILWRMNLLPFDPLPPHTPRRFVPEGIDLGDWSRMAPLFDRLDMAAPQCGDVADLERWLVGWSELSAALDEESSRRYIAMTCHTDNTDAEKAYLHFVENIEPQLKPRQFKLEKTYLQHPLRDRLRRERYEVFDRNTKVRIELYRDENVPLETEEAQLSQQYQKLS